MQRVGLHVHCHTFRNFKATGKIHCFKMWNKTKYNSNLSTINFTKQCKQLQELFDILQTSVSYSGLKEVSNVKTITKAITIW